MQKFTYLYKLLCANAKSNLLVENGKEDNSDVEFGITRCLFGNTEVSEMKNGGEENSDVEFSITQCLFGNNGDSNMLAD